VGIPRSNRLRRNRDFQRVRTHGFTWVNHWLVLGVLANDVHRVRVGVATSRRVGGAVERVRARRLVREAIRPRLKEINGGWDLVFIARRVMATATFRDVDRAVKELLERAGLLSEAKQ
jgi:ribonuclease P protein component